MWFHKALILTQIATSGSAWAGEGETVALGRRLLAENDCNGACHQKHAPDGVALNLYTRPNPKVKDLPGLRKQVERCVSSLNAPVAPDEINAIVAALNQDYYKFK